MTISDWQICTLVVAAAASTLFVFAYGLFARWWRTQVGRALMLSEISLAILLDLSLVAHWTGYRVPDGVAEGIFIGIAVTSLMRLYAFGYVQVRSRWLTARSNRAA